MQLNNYPHNYLTNIIYKYFKKYRPGIVYTHYKHDLNIDHYHAFYSTFVASGPNNDFKISKLLCFEIPSSTDWGIGNKSFIHNYFVNIKKYKSQKEKLLKFYKHEMRLLPHTRLIKNLNSLSIFKGVLLGLIMPRHFWCIELLIKNI